MTPKNPWKEGHEFLPTSRPGLLQGTKYATHQARAFSSMAKTLIQVGLVEDHNNKENNNNNNNNNENNKNNNGFETAVLNMISDPDRARRIMTDLKDVLLANGYTAPAVQQHRRALGLTLALLNSPAANEHDVATIHKAIASRNAEKLSLPRKEFRDESVAVEPLIETVLSSTIINHDEYKTARATAALCLASSTAGLRGSSIADIDVSLISVKTINAEGELSPWKTMTISETSSVAMDEIAMIGLHQHSRDKGDLLRNSPFCSKHIIVNTSPTMQKTIHYILSFINSEEATKRRERSQDGPSHMFHVLTPSASGTYSRISADTIRAQVTSLLRDTEIFGLNIDKKRSFKICRKSALHELLEQGTSIDDCCVMMKWRHVDTAIAHYNVNAPSRVAIRRFHEQCNTVTASPQCLRNGAKKGDPFSLSDDNIEPTVRVVSFPSKGPKRSAPIIESICED